MGYTLTIGNAKPFHSKDDGELYACWDVEGMTHADAPTFANDEMTGNSNSRSPSYTAWKDFAVATGLDDLFFEKWEGLLRSHPGCVMLTQAHAKAITEALARYTRSKPAGFDGFPKFNEATKELVTPDAGKYDAHLARLLWLQWWVTYAVEHCETPALRNT